VSLRRTAVTSLKAVAVHRCQSPAEDQLVSNTRTLARWLSLLTTFYSSIVSQKSCFHSATCRPGACISARGEARGKNIWVNVPRRRGKMLKIHRNTSFLEIVLPSAYTVDIKMHHIVAKMRCNNSILRCYGYPSE